MRPSDLYVLLKQSPRPVNSRAPPDRPPTSTAKRVRAKSSGYTMHSDVAPAAAPDAKFPKKYRPSCVFLSMPFKKIYLYLSFSAKFSACVGKYRITLAKLPRQNATKPCSFGMRTKQSMIPELIDRRSH